MGRWWARRSKAGVSTLRFFNRRRAALSLWLEPWAEEFELPSGSRLDLVLAGPDLATADLSFEWGGDSLCFFAPAGCTARIFVDGTEQESISAELPCPESGNMGTRGFIQTVFGDFPETRPCGQPADAGLGAPMARDGLRLEPLEERHRGPLRAACAEDLEIWKIYSTSYDPEHFDESFDRLLARPDWRPFAIFDDESLVGMSCYIGIDEPRGVLEIGNTYYVPRLRGTGFNRRVKDLMIARAFASGFRRIEFRVDARNARSQGAMAKIGGVREGVIRQDRITWNGHVRDTVLFSILADEWPGRSQAA